MRRPAHLLLSAIAVFTAVFTFPATAQEPFVCGTSPTEIARDEAQAQWSQARRLERISAGEGGAAAITTRDNVVIVNADDVTAPFRRPFDLAGKSITFTPNGDGYTATTGESQYDEARGSLNTFGSERTIEYSLRGFELPLFGANVKKLYLSRNNFISLEPLPADEFDQYTDLELAALRQTIIAPLLTTSAIQPDAPTLWINETADALLVTWRMTRTNHTYDVQARLAKNGEIRFSYRTVEVWSASVVMTSGNESWRTNRARLGGGSDSSTDVPATAPQFLNVVSLAVDRVAGTNLLEVRIELAQPLDRSAITSSAMYLVTFGSINPHRYTISSPGGSDTYAIPLWGTRTNDPAASFNGQTITMYVLQDLLTIGTGPIEVRVTTYNGNTSVDGATTTAQLDLPARSVRTDFSTASGTSLAGSPIAESFTLSPISVTDVWYQVRAAYNLREDEWDGVAIYQNFFTDLVTYAGAYSTVGNPGVDNIASRGGYGTRFGRSPALMHMNKIAYSPNRDEKAASHVVMHEFGHHWLYFLRFRDGNTNSTMLNPLGGHPAQYVDTRAAFPVYGADDSSVMGGGTFRTNADGSFTSTPYASYGYSWHDLYLMGLATASEVQPWYYIADSQPRLADAYYPPQNRTFAGTRKDVRIDQVITAMGARTPAYPNTQRNFRVLFVLLADPSREPLPEEMAQMQLYRRVLEENFRTATAARATVSTTFPLQPPGPRRRASGK